MARAVSDNTPKSAMTPRATVINRRIVEFHEMMIRPLASAILKAGAGNPGRAKSGSDNLQSLVGKKVWLARRPGLQTLVAGKPPQCVLGHETVAAGIAGPEIADDVVGNVGGSFRGYH